MWISYKIYNWVNPETGREPVTGDEFLYMFHSSSDVTDKIHLCIEPAVNPIIKHPIGFIGWLLVGLNFALPENINLLPLIGLIFITGTMISFIFYIPFYLKEKEWKKQVLKDWKSDLLRYRYSGLELRKFHNWDEVQDESKFY